MIFNTALLTTVCSPQQSNNHLSHIATDSQPVSLTHSNNLHTDDNERNMNNSQSIVRHKQHQQQFSLQLLSTVDKIRGLCWLKIAKQDMILRMKDRSFTRERLQIIQLAKKAEEFRSSFFNNSPSHTSSGFHTINEHSQGSSSSFQNSNLIPFYMKNNLNEKQMLQNNLNLPSLHTTNSINSSSVIDSKSLINHVSPILIQSQNISLQGLQDELAPSNFMEFPLEDVAENSSFSDTSTIQFFLPCGLASSLEESVKMDETLLLKKRNDEKKDQDLVSQTALPIHAVNHHHHQKCSTSNPWLAASEYDFSSLLPTNGNASLDWLFHEIDQSGDSSVIKRNVDEPIDHYNIAVKRRLVSTT